MTADHPRRRALCGALMWAPALAWAQAPIPAPLSLRLRPASSVIPAGDDVVLQIEHRVHQRLVMDTVELNQGRSRITIEPVAPAGPARVLTGADYVQREVAAGRWGPREVGRSFVAEPGDAWVSALHLSLFAPPLPIGRYRIRLAYQWGELEAQTLATPAVEVTVTGP